MLTLYLDLEKLRFGNSLNCRIEVADNIDVEETELPGMIIQPFVENALKHGLLHKQGDKTLHVTFAKKGTALVCTVQDNGIGRSASAEINARKKKHRSFATNATTERLRLLNEYYGLKLELKVEDPEQGTRVTIIIPDKKNSE